MRRAVIDIAEYARWFDMGWSREGDALRATVSFAAVAPFIENRHLRVTDLAVVRLLWPFAGGWWTRWGGYTVSAGISLPVVRVETRRRRCVHL